MDSAKLVEGLKRAWRTEIVESRTYRALASHEPNPDKRAVLERLALAEEKHAEKWATRLRELGVRLKPVRETWFERLRRRYLVQAGTDRAVRTIEANEEHATAMYEEILANAPEEKDRVAVKATQTEERAHAKLMVEMSRPVPAERRLEQILSAEKWHVRAGGWIGQAIYGVNDGLGAAFGVVSGVAGATNVRGEFVLISGFVAMLASALSMGSGAYLATKSEREIYEAELERERKEIELDPEHEREEMELFYQLKGFSAKEAQRLASKLAEQPEQLLKTMAHEELGLSEQTFPNPTRSALSATISTALGALVPVLPFFLMSGVPALIVSFIISTFAHFVVGASKVIVTGRSWLKSGSEMTLVGLGEASATYLIGLLIGPFLRL